SQLSSLVCSLHFFFTDTPTSELYPLSLHDALPICGHPVRVVDVGDEADAADDGAVAHGPVAGDGFFVDGAPEGSFACVVDVVAELVVVGLQGRVLFDESEEGGDVAGSDAGASGGEPVGAVGVGGEDESAGGCDLPAGGRGLSPGLRGRRHQASPPCSPSRRSSPSRTPAATASPAVDTDRRRYSARRRDF